MVLLDKNKEVVARINLETTSRAVVFECQGHEFAGYVSKWVRYDARSKLLPLQEVTVSSDGIIHVPFLTPAIAVRGGKREGGGRPATGKKGQSRSFYVTDEEWEMLKIALAEYRQNRSE